jgi:hypothetical protein
MDCAPPIPGRVNEDDVLAIPARISWLCALRSPISMGVFVHHRWRRRTCARVEVCAVKCARVGEEPVSPATHNKAPDRANAYPRVSLCSAFATAARISGRPKNSLWHSGAVWPCAGRAKRYPPSSSLLPQDKAPETSLPFPTAPSPQFCRPPQSPRLPCSVRRACRKTPH